MKWAVIILLIFSLNCLAAQKVDSIESLECLSPIEIWPKWCHGSNRELIQEIISCIKYSNGKSIEGTTYLQFMVDTFGHVKVPKILRSISKEIDKQLLMIICNYNFEPGVLINQKAEFILNLPIRIRLDI